jgi:hypothetical protein
LPFRDFCGEFFPDSLLQSRFNSDLALQQEICAFSAAEDDVLNHSWVEGKSKYQSLL